MPAGRRFVPIDANAYYSDGVVAPETQPATARSSHDIIASDRL